MIERVNLTLKTWTKVIMCIYENPDTTITNIHQILRISPAHNSRILGLLENRALIKKKVGRNSTNIDLTDNGLIIAYHLIEINKIINNGGKQDARHI